MAEYWSVALLTGIVGFLAWLPVYLWIRNRRLRVLIEMLQGMMGILLVTEPIRGVVWPLLGGGEEPPGESWRWFLAFVAVSAHLSRGVKKGIALAVGIAGVVSPIATVFGLLSSLFFGLWLRADERPNDCRSILIGLFLFYVTHMVLYSFEVFHLWGIAAILLLISRYEGEMDDILGIKTEES